MESYYYHDSQTSYQPWGKSFSVSTFLPNSQGMRTYSYIRRSSWIRNNLSPCTTLLMHSPASLLGYETGGHISLPLLDLGVQCHTEGKVDIANLGYHTNWCTYSDLNAILVGFGSWYSFIIICTPGTRPPGDLYLLHQHSYFIMTSSWHHTHIWCRADVLKDDIPSNLASYPGSYPNPNSNSLSLPTESLGTRLHLSNIRAVHINSNSECVWGNTNDDIICIANDITINLQHLNCGPKAQVLSPYKTSSYSWKGLDVVYTLALAKWLKHSLALHFWAFKTYHSVMKPATPSFSASLIRRATTSWSMSSHKMVLRGWLCQRGSNMDVWQVWENGPPLPYVHTCPFLSNRMQYMW